MARNDGKDYAVARNGKYSRSQIGNIERHNERKNEEYQNKDIDLERSNLNIYFKKATDGYITTFDKMCEENTISTKGLKNNAFIIDELLLDVNTSYFENRGAESLCGSYEYAKEFFGKAYDFAVKEIGGEEYILSAVMHADERNEYLSEKLGKDVYHYHLHIMYVPVVEKEVKWSKRCKDKSLVGTVKEVITQVSHSKKWASHKVIDEDGKPYFEKSYSLLQDRFFNYMRDCGYNDIERGEKGSKDKNELPSKFKRQQEELHYKETVAKVVKAEKALEKTADKQVKISNIDNIEVKPAMIDKSKVVVDKAEFENLKAVAKKHIATKSKEKKLSAENKQLKEENYSLHQVNSQQAKKLFDHNSISNKLNKEKDKIRMSELEKLIDIVMKFLDKLGLSGQFEQFRKAFAHEKNEVQR